MRPNAEYLAGVVERVRGEDVTYEQPGGTKSIALPGGYDHLWEAAVVGRGEIGWARSRDALRHWQAHLYAGFTITPADAPIEPGTVIVTSRRVGPVFVVAPCRVIYRTDEEDRFDFALGTLPGHPEHGEEAFHLNRTEQGAVRFEVITFSRPAGLAARLGGSLARGVQAAIVRRYLKGVEAYVNAGTGTSADVGG
jgi:uncharacterized protein (UPF0548 family)